ncbi:MAG: ComEC/Rec2 family competence protein [Bacteroidota bacterium]
MKVLQFPLVRITLFFVFGILVAQNIKPKLNWVIIALFLAFFSLIFSYFFFKQRQKKPFIFGILTLVISFLVGIFTLINSIQTNNPNHYLHQLKEPEKNCLATIIIKEKLKTSANFDRYVAQLLQLNSTKSYGKVVVNIKRNNTSQPIDFGTHLKVNGTLSKNKKPNNPNQFDYAHYLENQQIYGQLYTDYSKVKTSAFANKSVSYYASKLRNKIIHNLEKNHFNKTELSVVIALLLGQQQDISQEVIRDYQYAGAIHILSVSGLHVGLILLFITFLLKPIPNTRRNSFIKLIVVVLSLWGFGILAGLTPSVVRSVTMFSFVAIGMFLRRSVNIYHTLLVSVLLILLFQPSFLFDIGFQLSYIALFFIVWLQPFLAAIWIPKNKIITYFWDIITVSFAAQIGTLPLSLYYFHQFPGLFFVTNLVVLPMLSFILGMGVVVMILASFDIVWIPLLKVLEGSILILNKIIHWVASFEGFIIKDISVNWLMMLTSYLLIFSLIIWWMQPNFKKLVFGLTVVILLQLITLQTTYSNKKQEEFIVFHRKKKTLITERNGTQVKVYTNEDALEISPLKSYLVANFCIIQKKQSLSKLYYFNDTKILLMDSLALYEGIEKPDVLLLTNSPKVNLERLFKLWKPSQVVVDASNFKSYVKLWKVTCRKEKIPFHDTSEKGYYKL